MNGIENAKDQFDFDLLKNRTIYLNGSVEHNTTKRIGACILWLNALSMQPITLYINSNGGGVTAGLDIYDIIKHSQAPVDGIVFREARSMGAFILQACRTRKILQHAIIHLHHSLVERPLDELEGDLGNSIKNAKKDQEFIFRVFEKRTGESLEKVRGFFGKGYEGITHSAEKSKELNLVDEIIIDN